MNERGAATRKAIRTPKAAAIAGILFAVLLSAAVILVRVAIPEDSRQAGDWALDDSDRRMVSIALHLLPFAGIAFLWFVGVVRDRLGENEDRFFATVFLGSGLLFVAMLFCAGALAAGLLVSADDARFEGLPVWFYGRRVTYSLITIYAMRMAGVFMISSTTLLMRLQLVPKWLVIGGYLGAVSLLLTSGSLPFVELIFPLWVLILSLHILAATWRLRSSEAEPQTAPAAT